MKISICSFVGLLALSSLAAPLKTLIVDGQNGHDWKGTTPVLKQQLTAAGVFSVEVATAPKKGADLSAFKPDFGAYDVVILNYDGDAWSPGTQTAFVNYVRGGGGLVIVHAANNAFPQWREFNEMIAVGGWGGRNQKSGPYLRLRDGKWATDDTTPGPGGSHGAQHAFVVETREPHHPIMAGLPDKWLHAPDELYDRLRGPAQQVTVLASSFSDKKTNGSGEHEPVLMAIQFGKGRVFHTVLGHGPEAMKCAGFAVTFTRGAEWAATGKVTQSVPADFPKSDRTSLRP